MRAREWAVARFREPIDYEIPDLPTWRICHDERGGLALADGDREPFIAAERPVEVRR